MVLFSMVFAALWLFFFNFMLPHCSNDIFFGHAAFLNHESTMQLVHCCPASCSFPNAGAFDFSLFGVAKSPAPMVMDDHDEEEEDDEADYVAECGVVTVMIGKSFFFACRREQPSSSSNRQI